MNQIFLVKQSMTNVVGRQMWCYCFRLPCFQVATKLLQPPVAASCLCHCLLYLKGICLLMYSGQLPQLRNCLSFLQHFTGSR